MRNLIHIPPANPPPRFRFGGQVYTWFMNGAGRTHANRLEHMIQVLAQAGFRGIEPIHFWMGDLADPERLAGCLARHGLALAGVSLVLEWNHAEETPEERRQADQTIALLEPFPGAVLGLVQKPAGRFDVAERHQRLLRHLHAVAQRAQDRGVTASFHPNSPHDSITRTRQDYAILLGGLNPSRLGWTPDVGHLRNAGMDPLAMMKAFAPLINHVHYKDWDGRPEFALMGAGSIDFIAITRWLLEQDYAGWIICEDEAPAALADPDEVTRHDGKWIHHRLLPELATTLPPQ